MLVSVIIPIRNEEKHIGITLDALLAQELYAKEYEFLIVDGMSTDNTREIAQRYADKYENIHLFENPKKLSSAARNIGVKNAQGEYILIVDGHCIIDNPNMLANAVKAFNSRTEGSGAKPDCLARPQPLELDGATPLQLAVAAARRSRLGHHPDSFIYSGQAQWCPASSAAIAYRKEVFDTVGYFDEMFDACEDVEFNTRIDKAELKCWFDPSIAVSYVPRNSLSGLFYQMFRYGKGRVKLFRKHPETFSLKTFGLGGFVAYVIFSFCLLCFLELFRISVSVIFSENIDFWYNSYYLGFSAGYTTHPYPLASTVCRYIEYAELSGFVILYIVLAIYSIAVMLESVRLTLFMRNSALLRFRLLLNLPFVFIAIHFGFGLGILRGWIKFRRQC
ncbi:hypothetical protein FACS1894214_2260 [Planctomycetales bacterium]|nr:hypothetical protein FACS1894214_2260 [Planctomycetales bacterium]